MRLTRHSSVPAKNYDPDKGLKSVAVAEAAELHYQRAKDATKLLDAVEFKLAEQRKFILWWDGATGRKGGGDNRSPLRTVKGDLAGRNGLPTTDVLHRWRIRLKAEPHYLRTLAAAQDRCIRTCEAQKGSTEQRGASGTNVNEWFTPAQYITAARDVLGEIDLDPASNELAQETVGASRYFTKTDDGLVRSWPGRVWLNPPYMQPDIAMFIHKLVEEVALGRTTAAILLTHNYTDTAWFHLAVSACSAICFTRGRVAFVAPDGTEAAPTQGQAFFYFGSAVESFGRRFAEIGFVVKPLR